MMNKIWQAVLGMVFLLGGLTHPVYANHLSENQEITLVLLRHGESTFNLEKRFSGWSNIDLTPKGVLQAQKAGEQMKKAGLKFDEVHTSVLQRAIKTAWASMAVMGDVHTPQTGYWRLNERHYGDLEGKTHAEMIAKEGEKKVKTWRRSLDVAPPPLSDGDVRSPAREAQYAHIDPRILPKGESLQDTVTRIAPYWNDHLRPALYQGKNILVVSHSSALKALTYWIENDIQPKDLPTLELPNATPVVYRLKIKGNQIQIVNKAILGKADSE
ncbi:2,3-bisphosphoglycerate-dependent phosphoglycerate mutase [Alysiella filiformis]|uniref:2,3-bisphosphoglycerate-dependent phosphoglycerate mutase n=1 Tax=Alysiella filiformis DSM 16848 TaxID=1120981 RepID=A0A286EHD3_9NEIS|nr:2,3-bisphosphoglycerate-dependent phosphoglycerate mutase [Alysiella filiformis]QMT32341.1 2,3-bisphosphoglycerate-dependent phosphoglycerate mutase [Alysiella filiformis]UBQ56739.1 2,3-bisphosphoglycerate-dependent phosphoglycerate mutase [Alysiella filiformis DSM 16848]SOD70229.1 2,3-bisphosphoglycerate-dependent phosphoglycerate mutase [Alysiella filiformis DSM 16848]